MPQQINLLDASLLPQRQRLQPATLLAVVGAAVGLLLAHFAWERVALARALDPVTQGLAAASATAADAAASDPSATSATSATRAEQVARGAALRELLREQPTVPEGAAQLMGQIVQTLPEAVWLTELELGAARAVRISGGTTDAASFGQFTTRLGGIALLQGIPIGTLRLEPNTAGTAASETGSGAQLFVLASAATTAAAAPGAAAKDPR